MKLALFGGSRGTGKHVLDQALAAGHQVTAFARNPAVIDPKDRLDFVRGDVSEPAQVEEAVKGHDAVIFCVGPTSTKQTTPICTIGIQHVIAAMKKHGVRRLIFLSAWGTSDSKALMPWPFRVMMDLMIKHPMADKETAEVAVKNSGLDWVIVRPGGLNDRAAKGGVRAVIPPAKRPSAMIGRADVAAFLLSQLSSEQYLRQSPIIGY